MTKSEAIKILRSMLVFLDGNCQKSLFDDVVNAIVYLDGGTSGVREWKTGEYSSGYLDIYKAYPVKQRKRDGFVNYMKILRDTKYTHEDLAKAVENYSKHVSKSGTKFVVYINNFFGRGDFEDWINVSSINEEEKKEIFAEFKGWAKEKYGDDVFSTPLGKTLLDSFMEKR